MTEHPLASRGDPNAYEGTIFAVHNLKYRQALTLQRAWSIILHREGSPDIMPEDAREQTKLVLQELGYREYAVRPVDGGEAENLWIRPDWPIERLEYVPID